jgi:hypothetical protein
VEPEYAEGAMTVEADTATSAPSDGKSIDPQLEDREEDVEADADHEVDDLADSKPKKKRRVVKLSDKKYECPQPDCGKSYSRAEHLYRHQLNRTYNMAGSRGISRSDR